MSSTWARTRSTLLVVDAYHGAAPRSTYSYKTELRLAELMEPDGRIGDDGARDLAAFVGEAAEVAEPRAQRNSRIRDFRNPRGPKRR